MLRRSRSKLPSVQKRRYSRKLRSPSRRRNLPPDPREGRRRTLPQRHSPVPWTSVKCWRIGDELHAQPRAPRSLRRLSPPRRRQRRRRSRKRHPRSRPHRNGAACINAIFKGSKNKNGCTRRDGGAHSEMSVQRLREHNQNDADKKPLARSLGLRGCPRVACLSDDASGAAARVVRSRNCFGQGYDRHVAGTRRSRRARDEPRSS
jgi:hypothetical protein